MSAFTESFGAVWAHKHGVSHTSNVGDSLTDAFARLPGAIDGHGPDGTYGLRGCLLLANDTEWKRYHQAHGHQGSHQLRRMVCGPDSDADNVLAEIFDQVARAELDVIRDSRFTTDYKNGLIREARADARAQVEALGGKLLSEATAKRDTAKAAYSKAYGTWRASWDTNAQLAAVQTAGPLAASHPVEISAAINEAAEQGDYHALAAINTMVMPMLMLRAKTPAEKEVYGNHDLIVDFKQRLATEMASMEPDELRALHSELAQAQAALDKIQAHVTSVAERYKHFQ